MQHVQEKYINAMTAFFTQELPQHVKPFFFSFPSDVQSEETRPFQREPQ